jgi:hypothetical protein
VALITIARWRLAHQMQVRRRFLTHGVVDLPSHVVLSPNSVTIQAELQSSVA